MLQHTNVPTFSALALAFLGPALRQYFHEPKPRLTFFASVNGPALDADLKAEDTSISV